MSQEATCELRGMGKLGENSASVSAIISKEQKEKLAAIAKGQRRSVSQLLAIVIEEWLDKESTRDS